MMARKNSEVEELDWYHPNLNRHHAEAILIHNGKNGSYLLRPSTSQEGEYSLSCRCASAVKHFQIGWDGVFYTFGFGRFNNLAHFVNHFENKPLIGGESGELTILKFPYPRNIDEPNSYEVVRVHAEWKDRPSSMNDEICEPTSINSKEGYLVKQGGRIRTWKVRWFVLCKNELKYFKTKGANEAISSLDLNDCIAIKEDFESGRENSIRIEMPTRNYIVCASTPSDKKEWLSILKWRMNHKSNN